MTRPSDVQVIAAAFLDHFGLKWLDDIEAIALGLGLRIEEVPVRAFEGGLLRIKEANAGTILISNSIRDAGRRRFTLAHELGHYLLPNHGRGEGYCRGQKLDSWGSSLSRMEREANEFAAEVLMPAPLISDLLAAEPDYASASKISQRCESSLSASAYRLAELTSHRFAVIWSENGQVKWSKGSKEFQAEFRVRHDACDHSTLAAKCFAGKEVPMGYDLVKADSWLYEGNLCSGAELLEHSISIPAYNAVITFLLANQIIELCSRFGDEW